LIKRDQIINSVLKSEFEDYENIFEDSLKEEIEQYLIDKVSDFIAGDKNENNTL
jgi:hypothetical protein